MPLNAILYIIYSNTSVTISAIVAFLFWHRRNANGAKCMAFMMLCAAEWGLSEFLSDLSSYFPYKVFWDNCAYFGVVTIPVAWLVFALQYTRSEKYLTRRNLLLLSIIPFLTLLMVWTNNFHHLFETPLGVTQISIITKLDLAFGIWFWIHVAYSYTLISCGAILLIKKLVSQPKIYRIQSIIMILAILYPFIGNALYTFGISPSYPVDPTAFSFTITGILFFWGMFSFKLFGLVHAARAAAIESMDEFVIVLDNQNRIIDINSYAKKAVGKSGTDFIGESILSFLGIWSDQFIKYESTFNVNEKITISEGNNSKHFELRIAPLYDSKNKISGRFIVMHDITVLEEAIESSEQSRKAAENANKAKSQFLATMSHEIRTPLNGIIGMTELLSSANLDEEEKGHLLTVQNSANSLLGIVNDILDFSKIEAGKMELEKTNFNLGDLVDTIIKTFLHKKSEKNIELIYEIDRDIPENLVGDPTKLRQVLINLIGNAFKFTEKGQIEVKIVKLKCENHQMLVQFSVSDTGIGIPVNKIDNLFKSFQQLDSSTTRRYGGTGLGLAIVKNLITMMGGSIEVESKPDEGSKFFFTIPLQMAESQLPNDVTVPDTDFMDKNISILLAEDNKVNQMFMIKLLERKKLRVDVAENGKKVLEKLSQKPYDLILMDIQMPEMDGYEATLAIRKNEVNTSTHIPIIALTANATEEDREKCLQAGMDDFITKPVKSQKIYACLKKYIS